MNLTPGRRFASGERAAYELIGPAFEAPRHAFHRARKVLWNFRLDAPILYEAEPDECLDVLARVPLRAGPTDLRFELESVLALPFAPGLPLPLDAIETPDGPLLILAIPPGERLPEGPPPDPAAVGRRARFLREALELLAVLHHHHLVSGGLDPRDFLLEASGSWCFLGTDRVAPASPEASTSDDLLRWASLADQVLGGRHLGAGDSPAGYDGEGRGLTSWEASLRGPDLDDFRWVVRRSLACRDAGPDGPPSAEDLLRGGPRVERPSGRLVTLRAAFGSLGRQLLRGRGSE